MTAQEEVEVRSENKTQKLILTVEPWISALRQNITVCSWAVLLKLVTNMNTSILSENSGQKGSSSNQNLHLPLLLHARQKQRSQVKYIIWLLCTPTLLARRLFAHNPAGTKGLRSVSENNFAPLNFF